MDRKKKAIQNPKSKIQNRTISPARRAAFETLLRIEREKAFSAVLLPLYEEKLEPKDRALCHHLVLGVLRKQIFLDRTVQKFIKGKTEKLDAEVLISLRLGVYQLLFLDKIPAFAAINESVNLVRQAKKHSAGGLVNAVLRKIGREDPALPEQADEIEKISVETSHPRWLIELWTENFGPAETERLAAANNQTPPMAFRLTARSDDKTIETLKKLDLAIEESKIAAGAWRVVRGNELLRAYADAGKIYFQEESSQLVANAVKLEEGEVFLDACAAPGSKTTMVAQRAIPNGDSGGGPAEGQIVAGDRYFHRLRVLKENCRKVGAENVRILAFDAESDLPFADETFDCILVDAPCSGTGTIRHNPEIRYFLQPKDFGELSRKQLKILKNASKVLKKGGRLIYSTCSLERIENETVIENFLSENKSFQKRAPDAPRQFLTPEGFARTSPPRDGTDGFFIAVLEKV